MKYEYAELIKTQKKKYEEEKREIERKYRMELEQKEKEKSMTMERTLNLSPMPLYEGFSNTNRPILNTDMVALLKSGVKHEDIDNDSKVMQQIDTKLEENDQYKGSIICFQFLAFKPSACCKRNYLPSSIFFSMDFFIYQNFETDIASISDNKGNFVNVPLVLKRYSKNSQAINGVDATFRIDPSMNVNETHREFIQYLHLNDLDVSIWDGESKLLFGTSNIKLLPLLRQGKSEVTISMDIDVTDDSRSILGSIQLTMTNKGIRTAEMQATNQSIYLNSIMCTGKKSRKRKIISHQITKGELTEFKSKLNTDDSMKSNYIKVEKYEKEDDYIMAQYKEYKLKEIVKASCITTNLHQAQKFICKLGQPSYFVKEIMNMSDNKEVFSVSCLDNNKICTLVTDPNEIASALETRSIKITNINNYAKDNSIVLDAKEASAFIFKFLSYQMKSIDETVTITLTRQGIRLDDIYIQPILVPIYLNKSYLVRKPECRNTSVNIEVPFQEKALFGVCDNPEVNVNVLENSQINISFVTKAAPQVVEYFIFIYNDIMKANLLYTCKISVISYKNVDLKLTAGEVLSHSILFNGKVINRKCKHL